MGHPLPPGHSYSRKSYSALPCCASISAALILPNVYGDVQVMQAEDDYPFLHFVMAKSFYGYAPTPG
jgi:hypothetical protein